MRIARIGVALMIAVCVLVGCSQKGPVVVPVSGVVTYDGKPLEGAAVVFVPQGEGARSSQGTTGADGRFKLSTFGKNDGALPGKHLVAISKAEETAAISKADLEKMQSEGVTAMPGYGDMMGGSGGSVKKAEQLIPEKYSDAKTSGIEVEVTLDGENEFTINLD